METIELESLVLRNKITEDLKDFDINVVKPNSNGVISHHTVFLYAI